MVAYDMINDGAYLGNLVQDRQKADDWARDLKAIVAYLTTNFSGAKRGKDVNKYIEKKLGVLIEEYTPKMVGDYHLSDMLTRLANSIKKYAKAIACSNCSVKVTNKDVDEAFSFIDFKMQFLADSTPKPEGPKLGKVEKRYQILLERYANRPISIKDLAREYRDRESDVVCDKTIERAVKHLIENGYAEKISKGEYNIKNNDV